MAPTLDQLIRDFRRAVLTLDVDLARRLMRAHRAQLQSMAPQLRDLVGMLQRTGQIDDAERWLRDNEAAQQLLAAAEEGMAEFGAYASEQIEARRLELVAAAAEHANELTYATIVGNADVTPAASRAIRAALSAIPVDAVISTVGALQPGSPVRALFDTFGQDTSRRLGETLVDSVTRGQGARDVARRMVDDLDGNAARALTIARTETHRAYRSAHLDRWRAMPSVYSGWTWSANLDERTCPVCIAKHGSEHALDEEFGSHPNCRCRPLPKTRDLTDIIGDTPETRELQAKIDAVQSERITGPEWFRRQPVEVQERIVGPKKYEAMRAGRITLGDVVVERRHPTWGLGHRTGSLKESLANARRTPRAPRTAAATARKSAPTKGRIVVSSDRYSAPAQSTKAYRDAAAVVRKVHDPKLTLHVAPNERNNGMSKLGAHTWGDHHRLRDGGSIVRVHHGSDPLRTTIHEIGHAIDFQLFGRADRLKMGTELRDERMQPWLKAMRASGVQQRVRDRWRDISKAHGTYLARPREVWARAYEQWITLRSGNKELQRLFEKSRAELPDQYWTDDEFEALAAAMDDLLLGRNDA